MILTLSWRAYLGMACPIPSFGIGASWAFPILLAKMPVIQSFCNDIHAGNALTPMKIFFGMVVSKRIIWPTCCGKIS